MPLIKSMMIPTTKPSYHTFTCSEWLARVHLEKFGLSSTRATCWSMRSSTLVNQSASSCTLPTTYWQNVAFWSRFNIHSLSIFGMHSMTTRTSSWCWISCWAAIWGSIWIDWGCSMSSRCAFILQIWSYPFITYTNVWLFIGNGYSKSCNC